MDDTIYMVAGAPGSGKSEALQHFLDLKSEYIAFDIDRLAVTASSFAGRDVITDESTGLPYRVLWFDIIRCVCRNRHRPILFSPFDPRQTADIGRLGWAPAIAWLLLDCSEDVRRERLGRRIDGWTKGMIDEALEDAAYLRLSITNRIDTGVHSADEVAKLILAWARRH